MRHGGEDSGREGAHRYLDFHLLLDLVDGVEARIRVRVVSSPLGESEDHSELPFTPEQQKHLDALLAMGRRNGLLTHAQQESLEEHGQRLFEAAFPTRVRAKLAECRQRAENENAGLRLRLRLAPELSALPWEYLYDSERGEFLSLSTKIAVVRYLDAGHTAPLSIAAPIRVLVVTASPTNRPTLDEAGELARLSKAVSKLVEEKRLEITHLAKTTTKKLLSALREQEFHVLHFVGHGEFHDGRGALTLCNDEGRAANVDTDQLAVLLAPYAKLRLAVLNACEGAQGDLADPFRGLAQGLIKKGLGAVVAMQFEISDDAARLFTGAFYEAIARGEPIDAAVASSRSEMFVTGKLNVEWGTPVLHMRAPDGHLFRLRQENELSPAQVPVPPARPSPTEPAGATENQETPASPPVPPRLSFEHEERKVTGWVWDFVKVAIHADPPTLPAGATLALTIDGETALPTPASATFPVHVTIPKRLRTVQVEAAVRMDGRTTTPIKLDFIPVRTFAVMAALFLAAVLYFHQLVSLSAGYVARSLALWGAFGGTLVAVAPVILKRVFQGAAKDLEPWLDRIPIRPSTLFVAAAVFTFVPTAYLAWSGEAITNHAGFALQIGTDAIPAGESRIAPKSYDAGFDAETCFAQPPGTFETCIPETMQPEAGVSGLLRIAQSTERHVYCRTRWSVEGFAREGKPRWVKTKPGTGCKPEPNDEVILRLGAFVDGGSANEGIRVAPQPDSPGFFDPAPIASVVAQWRSIEVNAAERATIEWRSDAGPVLGLVADIGDTTQTLAIPSPPIRLALLPSIGTALLHTSCLARVVAAPRWLDHIEVDGLYEWSADRGASALLCQDGLMGKRKGTLVTKAIPDSAWSLPAKSVPRTLSIRVGNETSTLTCQLPAEASTVKIGRHAQLPPSCVSAERKIRSATGAFSSESSAEHVEDQWFCWPDGFECGPPRRPTPCRLDAANMPSRWQNRCTLPSQEPLDESATRLYKQRFSELGVCSEIVLLDCP